MNHAEDAHALMIEVAHFRREVEIAMQVLAATLRERDEARAALVRANEGEKAWCAATAKAESERDALRAALTTATDGLFAARNMLQAINEGDPTPDRKRAADRAWDAEKKARAALVSGGDRG